VFPLTWHFGIELKLNFCLRFHFSETDIGELFIVKALIPLPLVLVAVQVLIFQRYKLLVLDQSWCAAVDVLQILAGHRLLQHKVLQRARIASAVQGIRSKEHLATIPHASHYGCGNILQTIVGKINMFQRANLHQVGKGQVVDLVVRQIEAAQVLWQVEDIN